MLEEKLKIIYQWKTGFKLPLSRCLMVDVGPRSELFIRNLYLKELCHIWIGKLIWKSIGTVHQELSLGAFFIEQLLNSWTYHSAIFAYQSKLVSLHNDNFHNPYRQLWLYAKIKNNNNENHHSYKIRISWVLNIERRVLFMRIYRRPESVYFFDRLHLSCGIFVS